MVIRNMDVHFISRKKVKKWSEKRFYRVHTSDVGNNVTVVISRPDPNSTFSFHPAIDILPIKLFFSKWISRR